MENIWRVSEFLAKKKFQDRIEDEERFEVVTERIFLAINMILWIVMGFVVSLVICHVYLKGIMKNLPVVFIITGYFAIIMFLTGYLFICRRK